MNKKSLKPQQMVKFSPQQERNRRAMFEALESRRTHLENVPLEVFLEVTTRCNLRCVFCAREHDDAFKSEGSRLGTMGETIFQEQVVPFLQSVHRVFPIGFGEPTLAPEFETILRGAKKSGAWVQFTTNGTLLNDQRQELLLETGVDMLTISIDGATKKTFEKLRPGAEWETVIGNAKALDQRKRKAGVDRPVVCLEFIAMRGNIEEMPDIVGIASEIGAALVRIEPLVPHAEALKDWRIEDYRRDGFGHLVDRTIANAEAKGIVLDAPGFGLPPSSLQFSLAGYRQGDAILPTEQTRTLRAMCTQPFTTIYVGFDGRVGTCCIGTHNLGNLNRQNWDEAWNGRSFQELRGMMLAGLTPPECRDCVRLERIPGEHYFDRELVVDHGVRGRQLPGVEQLIELELEGDQQAENDVLCVGASARNTTESWIEVWAELLDSEGHRMGDRLRRSLPPGKTVGEDLRFVIPQGAARPATLRISDSSSGALVSDLPLPPSTRATSIPPE